MSVAAPPEPAAPAAPPPVTPVPYPHDPVTVAVARYRSRAELAAHLFALDRLGNGPLVAVVGVRPGVELPEVPSARVVLTADRPVPNPAALPAPFEPDPFRAAVGAVAGLAPGEALLVLVPVDWAGPSPEYLAEHGRRWRDTPEASENGEFHPID